MSRLRKNTKGFTSLEFILLLVIAAIISGAGFFVYSANKRDQRASTRESEQVSTQGSIETETSEEAQPEEEKVADRKEVPPAEEVETKNTWTVNGATFKLDKSLGDLLVWNLTAENVNLSSSTLLEQEKKEYGDATLHCKANSYPLGRISVRDESTPYPGFVLVKKLDSGKYLYYQDDGMSSSSSCAIYRPKLKGMQEEQIAAIKAALKEAK
jgi:type II secretory pathway pseudopilin PulG